jgi:hypothetical protein
MNNHCLWAAQFGLIVSNMKPILIAVVLTALAGFARADDAALVVAGKGASLEQTLAQPHAANYRLLVLREELLRLRAAPAEEEVRLLLKQRSDLMPGVVAVAAASEWVNGTPSAADLALRSWCS